MEIFLSFLFFFQIVLRNFFVVHKQRFLGTLKILRTPLLPYITIIIIIIIVCYYYFSYTECVPRSRHVHLLPHPTANY